MTADCVDKEGKYIPPVHYMYIGVVISEPGKGEYAPGIYDDEGNLIRAFEETIVSNDQNTKPESGSQPSVTPNTPTSKVDSPATGDSDAMRIMLLMLFSACGIIFIYLSGKIEKQ